MKLENVQKIEAPVDTVWALTEDVERWPAITPTIACNPASVPHTDCMK